MRWCCVALGMLLWVARAAAGPQPTTPTAAQAAEIATLDKQLVALERQQAPFAAVKVARKLYEAERKASGDDSPKVVARRRVFAGALSAVGDYAEAGALYRLDLAKAEAEHGIESREVLWALGPVVGSVLSLGRFDEAEPLIQRTLALTKKLDGDHGTPYAQALLQYGSLLGFHNEYTAAVKLFEQSVQIQEALGPGPDDMIFSSSLQLLASAYWLTNQQPRAIAQYDRVIALMLRVAARDGDEQAPPRSAASLRCTCTAAARISPARCRSR